MDNKNQMPQVNNSVNKPAEKSAGLDVPSHEPKVEAEIEVVLPKVEIETPESQASTEVTIPKVPKSGIEVVAVREGFYNQMRIKKGHKFKVAKVESLGDWMTCVDPVLEKERKRRIEKKKKANR